MIFKWYIEGLILLNIRKSSHLCKLLVRLCDFVAFLPNFKKHFFGAYYIFKTI